MENFDELMRQKYDNDDPGGRFEFREEYWEQARALIEADEARRRKRRRFLLWWFFAGLMVLCAGLGWWRSSQGNLIGDAGRNERLENTAIGSETKEQKTQGSNTAEQIATTENKGQSDGVENETTNESNQITSSKNIDNQRGISNKNGVTTASKDAKIVATNKAGHRQNTKSSDNNNALSSRQMEQKGAQDKATIFQQPALSGAEKVPAESSAGVSPSGDPKAVNTLGTPEQATSADAESMPAGEKSSAGEAQKSIDRLLEQLFKLPLPFPPVQRADSSLMIKRVDATLPMAKQIKPVKDRPISVYISAAAMAYESAPDLRWLGFSGTLSAKYRLRPDWDLSLGLGMRYQPGSWRDSSGVEQIDTTHYSFGFESINSTRSAAGLLSLEIPIAASWHRGAFVLEAGVAPGRLLYALDRFKQTEENSFEGPSTLRNRLEKGNTSPYGKFYFNTFAGAAYRFTRNASITLRGNYRFGAIVKADNEDHPAVSRAPSVELGLSLKLF